MFKITPAFIILGLNLGLWWHISPHMQMRSNQLNLFKKSPTSKSTFLLKNRETKIQKSYYFTIIFIGVWLIFTTIPYCLFITYYYWKFANGKVEPTTRAIQLVSSIFFNSNRCINIFIYLLFHKEFRVQAFIIYKVIKKYIFLFKKVIFIL